MPFAPTILVSEALAQRPLAITQQKIFLVSSVHMYQQYEHAYGLFPE